MTQIFEAGHPKLMAQRLQYQEALRRQSTEVRRQIPMIAKDKDIPKKKRRPRPSNKQKSPKSVFTIPKETEDPPPAALPKARPRTTTPTTWSTPPHRKVARKKLLQDPRKQDSRPQCTTQCTSIHRKALRQHPFHHPVNYSAHQDLTPKNSWIQSTSRAWVLPTSKHSSLLPLPWQHHAWTAPTHRKALRQQPFLA